MLDDIALRPGNPWPLGCSTVEQTASFALFAQVSRVELELKHAEKRRRYALDPKHNRTGDVWHCAIRLPEHVQLTDVSYRFVADGAPCMDPYALLLDTTREWGEADPAEVSFAFVPDAAAERKFDWERLRHVRVPDEHLVVYETHVRGATLGDGAPCPAELRGTFLGLAHMASHIAATGATAIELLPVQAFNEQEASWRRDPTTGHALRQYWGYSTTSFLAPMPRFATRPRRAAVEFMEMCKAFHRQGMEVLLDVVYNHTAEMDDAGPTLHMKVLGRSVYYLLNDDGSYNNLSGCGNALNCSHPVVQDLVIASLRRWVDLGVDGFRFDLASILARDTRGAPIERPPLLARISADPVLSSVRLIAEAWDAAGLNLVGGFPSRHPLFHHRAPDAPRPRFALWAEWNGLYRDHARRFVRGADDNIVGDFATRFCGSEDLYASSGRSPTHSVNFVCAHDGFTLEDLVSFTSKRNERNGEGGRDGEAHNNSWDCGADGATERLEVLERRDRAKRALVTLLMLSQGTPMVWGGDELGMTRDGNNNGWCLDEPANYTPWSHSKVERHASFQRFFTSVVALRHGLAAGFFSRTAFLRETDIVWHGVEPEKPDWSPSSRLLACTLVGRNPDCGDVPLLYLAANVAAEAVHVTAPGVPGVARGDGKVGLAEWVLLVDTIRGWAARSSGTAARGSWERLIDAGREGGVVAPGAPIEVAAGGVVVLLGRARAGKH